LPSALADGRQVEMKLTEEEKREILETYKWIKVKKYMMDENLSWEERYRKLDEHHIEETNFLINKIREIVKEIGEQDLRK
jgi:hypothetical protein